MEKKKVRLGMIGAGGFAGTHLAQLKLVDIAEVVAIADVIPEHLEEKSKEFNISDTYLDYNELLKRDDIDAVVLPLPDQVHAEVAIAAMKAGKPVLCEKPMALDLEECREMVRVSRETGVPLMVGQIGRYTPSFVKAMELIKKGVIGDIFFIESEYAHDYSAIGGAGGWRVTPEREPIIGGGCHAVDLIRMLMNEDPTEVFAYANNMSLVDWPIHDCTVGIMKFPSGAIGKVMTSTGCKRRYTMRTVVQGTKGTLILDNSSPYITLNKEHFSDDPAFEGVNQQGTDIQIRCAINSHNFAAEATDFCKAILDGTPFVTTAESGLATAAICIGIVESFKTGEKVKLDYTV